MARSWDRVRSLRVVTVAAGEGREEGLREVRTELRISGDGSLYFDYAHGDGETYELDPNRARLFLREGTVFEEIPFRRVVSRYPVASMPPNRALELQPIWPLLAWWPEGSPLSCPEVHGHSITLPPLDSSDSSGDDPDSDALFLRTAHEEVELSREHGLAVRRRSWRDAQTGRLLSSMEVEEFFEVAPGVWFPLRYVVRRHSQENEREERIVRYRVLEASVDDLEPEDFVFHPPPGTFLIDAAERAGGRQLVPGGFDLMSAYVELLRRARPAGGARRPSTGPWIWGGVVGLATWLLGLRTIRRRHT